MVALVYEMRRAVARLECSSCGAEANASCDCGKPYVPAKVRAAEAVKANPEKSNRAIAADLGISDMTVGRARKGATDVAPEGVVGRDGKTYPAKPRTPKGYYDEPEDEPEDPKNHVTACWLRIDAARDLAAVPFKGEATQELVDAARAVASAWTTMALKLEEKL